MPNIPKSLTKEDAQALLLKVDNFLFDCDGVIWNWPHPIKGSVEFINQLKKLGKKCFFVTNNSSRTRETFARLLSQYGVLDIDVSQIVCTAWVLAEYLKVKNYKDKVYLIGNEAMINELDNSEIKHNALEENKDYVFNSLNYDMVKLDPEVKCVAVGIDYEFSFQKMIYGSSYVQRPGCEFLATNDDASIPTGSPDVVIPDAGSILETIRKCTGQSPLVIGKPNAIMWETLSKVHNLDPRRTCMIGDRLDTVKTINFLI